MYFRKTLRPSLWFAVSLCLLSIVQTSYRRDYFKNLLTWNRTVEKMSVGNYACSSGKIIKPHLDLYAEKKRIYLKIKVFQQPIDNTINILCDKTTIDVTRYVNNTCYNVDGKCSNNICKCNVSNKGLTSAYRTAFFSNCTSFGMEYRFENGNDGEIIKVTSFKSYNGLYFGRLQIQLSSLTKCNEDINECVTCFSVYTGLFVLGTIIVLSLIVLVKNSFFHDKILKLKINNCKKIALQRIRATRQESPNCSKTKCRMQESILPRDGRKEHKLKDVVMGVDNASKCKLRDSMQVASSTLINMSSDNRNKQDVSTKMNMMKET